MAVEDERNDDSDDEREARSCWHSSLWKAFHAARWQASLQNLRCRQPLQRSSFWLEFWLVARAPQCAHLSMVVGGFQLVLVLVSTGTGFQGTSVKSNSDQIRTIRENT